MMAGWLTTRVKLRVPATSSILLLIAVTVKSWSIGFWCSARSGKSNLYGVRNYHRLVRLRRLPSSTHARTAEKGYTVSQSLFQSFITTDVGVTSGVLNALAMSAARLWKPGAPSAAAMCRCCSSLVICQIYERLPLD